MSSFVSDLTVDLSTRVVLPTSVPPTPPGTQQKDKEALRSIFLNLNYHLSVSEVKECLETLQTYDNERAGSFDAGDDEEQALRRAVLGKVAVSLYAEALDTFLREASQAETEREWWNDIERSRTNVLYYLLQTLPSRLLDLLHTILATLRNRGIPLQASLFTPSSLRRLFPSTNILRPNALTVALFPHLHAQPYSIAFSTTSFPTTSSFATSPRESIASAFRAGVTSLATLVRTALAIVALPIELTKGECRYKQQELERIRDARAEILGRLAEMRGLLASALEESRHEQGLQKLTAFSAGLQAVTQGEGPAHARSQDALEALHAVAGTVLPSHVELHAADITTRELQRPSRLTLLWPKLVLLPPLALYGLRVAYASRAPLEDMARDAWATLRGFWEGWLLGPVHEIVRTVRAGGEDNVIITRESVRADLESLERMTLSLAQEKLGFDAAQMEALSQQIQRGDLTPVMQIYEEDIKSPLKSAVAGTLLRSLFIQVQKAKVDIDQALAGIDKLLKSQELTFAFVGVAPSLAIVYALGGYLRGLWKGGRGKGRYGGRKKRASVWLTMRRIERLLIAQPKSHHVSHDRAERTRENAPIPPLTAGLLLLSVSHLRTYAVRHLPSNSRVREGFLEDVVDLEDPALGRGEKLRVLDRMWKSWGEVLGWGRAAEDGGLV
ncbi:NCA2-domain-containing protein [Obba rivulosa]|uniref:NCA2-domain-containing protein n=1 Tax=Obba rivulosa TaxID=1052685 RepID=A0A8E2DMY7_9APHY|nr:NCA2-domain-containing protein [Obba rivulosa]